MIALCAGSRSELSVRTGLGRIPRGEDIPAVRRDPCWEELPALVVEVFGGNNFVEGEFHLRRVSDHDLQLLLF